MNLLSSDDTFLYSFQDNECDSETIEFSLTGERERNQIEAELKILTDIIRDQKDLIDKRECLQRRSYHIKILVGGRKQSKEVVQGKGRSMSKATR